MPSDERNARLAHKGGRREPEHAKSLTHKRNTRVLLGAVFLVRDDGRADHLRGGDDEWIRTGAVLTHVHGLPQFAIISVTMAWTSSVSGCQKPILTRAHFRRSSSIFSSSSRTSSDKTARPATTIAGMLRQ